MRALALLLVLANLLALAWWHGFFGRADPVGGEAQRVAAQVAPERLQPLSATQLAAAREHSRRQSAQPGGLDFSAGAICVELGDFAEPIATEVRARLAAENFGDRVALREVASSGWTLVVLPPARSRAEGERQLAAARKQGARDAWMIEDAGPLHWATALGAFRGGEAAQVHLAALEKQGIKGARVVPAPATVPALRLRAEAADAALGAQLAALGREFVGSRLAQCAN